MRNETTALSEVEVGIVRANKALLDGLGLVPVAFHYVSRPNVKTGAIKESDRVGTRTHYVGAMHLSTAAVGMDTDDGPRVFNLYLMSEIRQA